LFADEQNRLSPRDVSDVRIDPDGTAGWVTVNVRAQWLPLHGWRLGLLLGNLTDRRYRTHGSGIDSPGRTIGLSAQFDW
jgi:outer membrane receptor protein involved in Fe transport